MVEFVKLNGTPIRVTGLYRRAVDSDADAPTEELELVVVLRTGADHRALLALLERDELNLDIPDERGFKVALVSSTWTESGDGDEIAYRHDLTLREQPPTEPTAPPADEPVPTVEDAALADDEAGEVPLAATRSERTPATPTSPRSTVTDADAVVLIGMRLEALIEALAGAGMIELEAVDAAYDRLVAERLRADADAF